MTNVVKLEAGAKVSGIIPRSLDEIYKLSETIFKSGLAPQGTRSPDQVAVSILHGLEIGLPPLQSVQKVAVINGRPALWGDAVPALLWSKGFKLDERFEGAGDQLVAICTVTRPDGSVIERRFSVDDAKRARLWGKQGPWQQYSSRMLQMRARSFAARDGASEVLCGLYLAEEAMDIPPPKDITPTTIDVVASQVVEVIPDKLLEDQLAKLNALIKTPPETNIEKFLQYFKIDALENLPSARFEEAMTLLQKSKTKKKKGVKNA